MDAGCVEGKLPSTMQPSISSEIGPLREVILHRPGRELRRITPANRADLLFDELVWVDRAQVEHDAFADLLRAEGVQVRLLTELVSTTLADVEVRTAVIERLATPDSCGVELVDRVRGHLAELQPDALTACLLGGVTVAEVPGAGNGFVGGVLGPAAFLLPPLPNAVFTRDPSAWIGSGVVRAPMAMPARRAEQILWEAVYAHHPDFSGAEVWYGKSRGMHATLEGGDVLVLSPQCVAIGLSERTHPIAVENLAARLFAAGIAEWVLAVELPMARGTMHLDTVLTVVDVDAIVLWPRMRARGGVWRISPGPGGRMRVQDEPDLIAALAAGLGVDVLRVVTTAEDEVLADREQWDDGNNTLALRPGTVVAYERNVDTNRRLEDAGVRVHTIEGFELPRGRGGPRCMSCPVVRDAVPV
jgi:arginine deiminase